ncbi:restriction endonuclease subunit S [uncultured Thiodictyon sp.]|uniref:restriction endonuclease subunit S n=1 Tax=uncultured Thiodictyon sp. TaxID=1846217 RepID=UPI0025E6CE31|nr:restriction endonuclease subunit S [uncultured Thiodictyon sp.]
MSFPRYPSYKSSGVEWVGEVPGHWDVTRLKFVATVQTGVAKGKDNSGKSTIEVPYLRVANVQDGYLDLNEIATIEIPADDLARYSLRPGDVLMNEGGDYDKLGRGHVWQGEIAPCIHQNHVFAIRPTGISPQWLNLITGSGYARFYFMSRSKQSTNLASISSTNVMELPVVIPPAEERVTIAIFLDRETAKIDALTAEQRTLIELLKEKRQAVISHAVTKGLNPDAPMKDCGVEWLGEMPAHWSLKRLRVISPFIAVGIVVNPSEYVSEDGYPFIYGGDITEGKINFAAARRISDADSQKNGKTLLNEGDLLTVRVGAPGITAVVPKECEGGNCASVMLIRKGDFDSRWLCYAMNSRMIRYQVEIVQYGAAQEQFNISHAINFWVALPKLEEQIAIAACLDRETAHFDALTAEAEQAIALLQERRTALISAAVTGKIDVRGWTQ